METGLNNDPVSLKRGLRLATACLMAFFCAACQNAAEPPELKKAAHVIRYLSAKNQLKRSSFWVVYPEGKPSEFVNWMFSAFGSAEWPPHEDTADPMELEQARSIRAPIIPKDVALVPLAPNPDLKKQVVVRFDDAKGLLIANGYLDPAQPPVLIREWPLVKPLPAKRNHA